MKISGSKTDWNWKTFADYAGSIVLFTAVIAAFVSSVMWFSGQADREGADTLKAAIRRASVQCYAIEGRYPPSVQYLQDNYGIQIDEKRYCVFYNGFASNVMPDITVVEAEPVE